MIWRVVPLNQLTLGWWGTGGVAYAVTVEKQQQQPTQCGLVDKRTSGPLPANTGPVCGPV